MSSPRILICGDVLGRFNQLFKRVESVNKSTGPFDALLCVGQFFPDDPERLQELDDFMGGSPKIPLPTYFIGDYGVGSQKYLTVASKNSVNLGFKSDGYNVSENLYWIHGGAKFSLHGLSIAYLSGRKSSDGQLYGTYTQDDIDSLRALADEPVVVDLFLTNEWPCGVVNRASIDSLPPQASDSSGSDSVVSELVAEIKPRYHFSGSKGVFYAREPYSNVDAMHITRFVGLASVGNKNKQKFIHAISPTPAVNMSAADLSLKPPGSTLSPYAFEQNEDNKRLNEASNSQYWRYDVSNKRHRSENSNEYGHCFKFVYSDSCPRGKKCNYQHDLGAREQFLRGVCLDFILKGKCEKGPECRFKHELQELSESSTSKRSTECWFCLSSPNVENHLIVNLGDHYYCALPKGPLVTDHVLIIPIEHLANTIALDHQREAELLKFFNSVKQYYNSSEKHAVFFEWISKRNTHSNIQVVPIPSSKVGVVSEAFTKAAAKLGFKFIAEMVADGDDRRDLLRSEFDEKKSFFYVDLPDGTIMSHRVDDNEAFPAQFGREVLASLLNMPEKGDWRKCKFTKEEEVRLCDLFKKSFQEFAPF